MSEIVKICKIHGELTLEQTRKDGKQRRCKQCRSESNKRSYQEHREKRIREASIYKEKNRIHYRNWAREDRKKYPEKYSLYAKTHRGKYGVIRNIREIARNFGLTVQQYQQMIVDQENKCAICRNLETRKNRSGNIAALCVDHDHTTNKVRALLCHSCNTGIGKFKDNIDLLQSAITYLRKHECT